MLSLSLPVPRRSSINVIARCVGSRAVHHQTQPLSSNPVTSVGSLARMVFRLLLNQRDFAQTSALNAVHLYPIRSGILLTIGCRLDYWREAINWRSWRICMWAPRHPGTRSIRAAPSMKPCPGSRPSFSFFMQATSPNPAVNTVPFGRSGLQQAADRVPQRQACRAGLWALDRCQCGTSSPPFYISLSS